MGQTSAKLEDSVEKWRQISLSPAKQRQFSRPASASVPASARFANESGSRQASIRSNTPKTPRGSRSGLEWIHEHSKCPLETTNLMLSQDQKRLLLRAWPDDFDTLYNMGAKVYREVFTRAPDIQKLMFPSLTKYGDDWCDSKEFRSQALKFVQVLTLSIKGLNNVTSAVDPLLHRLGALHSKFIARGFEPEHWSVLQAAMDETIAEQIVTSNSTNSTTNTTATTNNDFDETTTKQVREAWSILTRYIVARMSEGFHRALNENKNNGSKKDSLADSNW